MRVDLAKSLISLRGERIRESDAPEANDTTLGAMMVEGLGRDLPGDEGGGGGAKLRRYRLAQKIVEALEIDGFLEIPESDVRMVLTRLGRFLPTMLLGPVHEAIGLELED